MRRIDERISHISMECVSLSLSRGLIPVHSRRADGVHLIEIISIVVECLLLFFPFAFVVFVGARAAESAFRYHIL